MRKFYLAIFVCLAILALAYSINAASTLKATFRISVGHSQVMGGNLGTPTDAATLNLTQEFVSGLASNSPNVRVLYYKQRTLSDGASETLGLVGSLTNNLGETIYVGTIKGFFLRNYSTIQSLEIGSGPAPVPFCNPATATFYVHPGGCEAKQSANGGWNVATGTADCITIQNGSLGTSTIYDIWLIGI